MTLRVIEKLYFRLKFLYRKNGFLDVSLCRLLCNVSIQPHFDYVFIAWYPNLTKKLKDKLQVTHNKSIWFCWKLNCRKYILNEHFEKLNWLSTNQRFKQGVIHTVFKCPAYMNEIFMPTENTRISTRNSCLKAYFSKTNTVQNGLSYIGHAEFQKFWGKRKTWILSNIRWNSTIWMISLT